MCLQIWFKPTQHTSYFGSRVNYGVFVMTSWMEIDRVKSPHSILASMSKCSIESSLNVFARDVNFSEFLQFVCFLFKPTLFAVT